MNITTDDGDRNQPVILSNASEIGFIYGALFICGGLCLCNMSRMYNKYKKRQRDQHILHIQEQQNSMNNVQEQQLIYSYDSVGNRIRNNSIDRNNNIEDTVDNSIKSNIIQKLKQFSLVIFGNNNDDVDECFICCYPLKNTIVRILPCFHKFHAGCIDKWLLTENKMICPICTCSINVANVTITEEGLCDHIGIKYIDDTGSIKSTETSAGSTISNTLSPTNSSNQDITDMPNIEENKSNVDEYDDTTREATI